MAKKKLPEKKDVEKIDIIIEGQQWESASLPGFTWRHGLILAILIAIGILFAFGFLIIAAIILMTAIVINIVLFIIRKLT